MPSEKYLSPALHQTGEKSKRSIHTREKPQLKQPIDI